MVEIVRCNEICLLQRDGAKNSVSKQFCMTFRRLSNLSIYRSTTMDLFFYVEHGNILKCWSFFFKEERENVCSTSLWKWIVKCRIKAIGITIDERKNGDELEQEAHSFLVHHHHKGVHIIPMILSDIVLCCRNRLCIVCTGISTRIQR